MLFFFFFSKRYWSSRVTIFLFLSSFLPCLVYTIEFVMAYGSFICI